MARPLTRFAGSNDARAAAAQFVQAPDAAPFHARDHAGRGPDGSTRFAGDLALSIEQQRREKEIERFLRLQEG
jgi:hypothetical protein